MAVSRTGSGFGFDIDTEALAGMAARLRRCSPVAYRAMRGSLRAAVTPIAEDAAARASVHSRTVPGSVRIRVTGGASVKILAGGERAPVGAPMEHRGVPGIFRHPLWGNWGKAPFKNTGKQWVAGDPRNQSAHPFLGPAAEAGSPAAAVKVSDAIESAVGRTLLP